MLTAVVARALLISAIIGAAAAFAPVSSRSSPLSVKSSSLSAKKPSLFDDDSSFACEVEYDGDTVARSKRCHKGKCFDSDLSPERAAALVMQGVETMAVSSYAMLEALACLEANAKASLASLTESEAATCVQQPPGQGFYRLVFSAGSALQALQLGAAAPASTGSYYTGAKKGLDLRLSASPSRISVDTNSGGLRKTLTGMYSMSEGAIMASFSRVKMGPLFLADEAAALAMSMCRHPLALRTFFVQGDVLAMECNIQGKEGVLVFKRDTSEGRSHMVSRAQANALKHAGHILGENLRENTRTAAAAAAVARPKATATPGSSSSSAAAVKRQAQHEKLQRLQAAPLKQIPVDREMERRRRQEDFVAVGKPDVMKYLHEEIPMLYAVIGGPTLLGFARMYYPIAVLKATAAAQYISTVMHHSS